jgi:hypothetical protein
MFSAFWWRRMRVSWLIFLLSAPAMGAAPRVTVLPFRGPEGGFVREQVLASLCEEVTCVAPSQVSGQKGPDWAKVRVKALDGVVSGVVARNRGAASLKVELFDREKHLSGQFSVKLDKQGHLPASQDRRLRQELERRVRLLGAGAPVSPPAQGEPAPEGVLTKADPLPAPVPEVPPAPVPARKLAPASAAQAPAPADTSSATASASTSTANAPPHRYKPLPPELLDWTPRI